MKTASTVKGKFQGEETLAQGDFQPFCFSLSADKIHILQQTAGECLCIRIQLLPTDLQVSAAEPGPWSAALIG